MIPRLSDALGIAPEALHAEGVFNSFLRIDSQFHVDPALLKQCPVPELKKSYQRVLEYFEQILVLASHSSGNGAIRRTAVERLTFPEINLAGLGFARDSKQGRAFGTKLATQLLDTTQEIVQAGIKDPVIFELVGLFEEGVGADLISDMTLFLILEDIIAFNQRASLSLGIPTHIQRILQRPVPLPYCTSNRQTVLLIPETILSPLPTAKSWDDIDTVTTYNRELRDRLNQVLGVTWRDATRKLPKRELKAILLKDPDLLRELIARYKSKDAVCYDFEKDPSGLFLWCDLANNTAHSNPLGLSQPSSHEQVVVVVRRICHQFKNLVEQNNLNAQLYEATGNPRPERFSQLLFYAIADSYCDANNLDLSREPNAGRGPVDFKMSSGYTSRVNVEIKLSTNKKVVSGFKDQLPTYNKSEKTFASFFMVIDVGGPGRWRASLFRERDVAISKGEKVPEIIIVDATVQPSASKL